MTALYGQTTITGSAHIRAKQIIIDHEYEQHPQVVYHTEIATIMDDGTAIMRTSTPLRYVFDPATVIPVRNPMTGEDTGQTATRGDIYALLYSDFIYQLQLEENQLQEVIRPESDESWREDAIG